VPGHEVKSLTVYSRRQCHLCDLLLEDLGALLGERGVIQVVDVDQDPRLRERYGLWIPVVVGDGQELSGYPLNRDAIRRYLDD